MCILLYIYVKTGLLGLEKLTSKRKIDIRGKIFLFDCLVQKDT